MNLTTFGPAGDNSTVVDPESNGSSSFETVISALIPTSTVGLAFVGAFVLVRHRFPILYAPRTFLGTVPDKDQTPSADHGYLDWLHTMRKLPDKFLLYHESLDAYLYLRFLRTIITICVVGCGLTWPVLMPVNATGGGSSTELDRITISNVTKTNHLYAHAVMAWVFLGFVLFTITRERLWLIGLRQAWTLSTSHAKRLSSRTVLFLSAPRDSLEQNNMYRFFGDSAVRVWPVTQPDTLQTLQTLVLERNVLVQKLESAETFLIHKANSWGAHRSGDRNNRYRLSYSDIPDLVKLAMRLRSMPRTFPSSFLPFASYFGIPQGEKVDTIQSLRDQVKEKEALIEEMRKSYEIEEPDGTAAVFVEFKTHADAQRAYEQVESPSHLILTPRYVGVKPNEVVWDNLTIPPVKRISRQGIALATVVVAIVFWSVPSGLVGIVSNISYLAENFESLGFLNDLPGPLNGLLSGLVPPLLTSYISKDVPVLFRSIFTSAGGPTNTAIELQVQRWGHVFQVTQVRIMANVEPNDLLPKSSNYYLTYFIVQGITSAADNLLNYSDLLEYLSLEYLVDETPRQKFTRYTNMKDIAWGQVFPKKNILTLPCLAIAYSCIASLVLGFAAAGLSLYYLSYRYNLFYVMQPQVDTQGRAYTLALRHLLAGVYIAELALIGFCGLRKAKGPSIITGVLFVVTILYSVLVNRYLIRLEDLSHPDLAASAKDNETVPLLSSVEQGRGTLVPSSVAERSGKPALLNPHGPVSYNFMKAWAREAKVYDLDEHDVPAYTEMELERAYLHPGLAAQTPLIWMPRDSIGASKAEVRETEECGLKASDEGAWLDESRIVRWDVHSFEKVPVWKRVVRY
ncbi:late exocytosis, associated with Golgi transport-domain-containing protein [Xylaria arbuscula]|nr:late exocytosis, associated with Golgi transport-domain-containing protein [Xylaria arbuscula]